MKEYTVKVFEDGSKRWYLDGKLHRVDGPAIEWADGPKAWWLYGQEVTEEEHRLRTSGITMDGALAAADGVILREQAERIKELEERVAWLETTLETVDAALKIGPLTGEDWEWMDVGEGVYQNARCSTVFKEVRDDGTEYAYDIDGKVFWEYYTDEDGVQQKSYYTCSESRVPVEFPYTVPDKPVYEYRESECE